MQIIDKAFPDNRIAASLINKKNTDSNYKPDDFDFQIDERPTRDRSGIPPRSN